MKSIFLAAVAAISLTAAARAESEGAGDPFAHRAPGITVVTAQPYADSGSAAYLDLHNRPWMAVMAGGADTVPATGSDAGVQTANSLPRGFAAGAAAYAQNRSMRRGRADRATLVSDGRPRG